MKYDCVSIIVLICSVAGGVLSFPLATLSTRSSTSLWLADKGKDTEGIIVDSHESDRLLAEIAELTESFEYAQRKNESNKRLYKERIAALQSQITELQTQLQDDELSSSSRTSDSEAMVHDATIRVGVSVEEGLMKMRIDWEKEKQALLDEKDALAKSIANLKQSIQHEAKLMRSDVQREYISLKANIIQERDAALRQSEAMRRELEAERSRRIELEGKKKDRRTVFRTFWKRLKSMFRRKRNE